MLRPTLLLITALLCTCLLATGCAGSGDLDSSPLHRSEPGERVNPAEGLPAVPFPVDEPAGAEADAARHTAGTEITTREGVQTWRRGGETVEAVSQLTLNPAADDLAWAVYQYSGMADGDTVTSVTVEVPSPGPADYYLGWADYSSRRWIWQRRGDKLASTSVDDVFEPPAGVSPISYHGNVHVAVVAWDALPVEIYSVALTAELNDVPVAVVFADPSIGNQDLTVDFDAGLSSVRGGGTITEYEWDWDGSVNGWNFESSGTSDTVQHLYTEPGVYEAVLRLTDDQDNQDLGTAGVTVSGWMHTWGGDASDLASAVAVDEAGSIYMAGYESSFGSGFHDVLLIKYDRAHQLCWARTLDSADGGIDEALGIAARDGCVYLAGRTRYLGGEEDDVLVLKYSGGGELLWARTWGGSGVDTGRCIALSGDDELYVAGWTTSFGNGAEVFLLKYDLAGNLAWAVTWGGAEFETANGVQVAGDGAVYLAGETKSFGDPMADLLVVKYDSAGAVSWARTWGGSAWDGARGISLDLAGGIYLAGGSGSFTVGEGSDVLAMQFDADGNALWAKTWGTAVSDVGQAVVAGGLIPGAVYVAGHADLSGYSYPLLLEFETDGEFQWHRYWLPDELEGEEFSGLAAGPGGVLTIAGYAFAAPGHWDDSSPQWVASHSQAAVAVTGNAQTVVGQTGEALDREEDAPVGTQDTGEGVIDALLLEFYPAEW